MTIKASEMIRRAVDILTGKAKVEKWSDVVALRYIASEARAKAKEAEERIPAPPTHAGRYSGNTPKAATTARNAAAKAVSGAMDKLVLLGKSLQGMKLQGMRVFELQKIAASALDIASFADLLLAKIGANADPNALVTECLSQKQIDKLYADALGKDVSKYRESAHPNA